MVDWGAGHYESTAAGLEPVAEHVVARAEPRPGQRVLDLATGTGNAALLAARTGAAVTGLDGAPRLIEVARARAAADGIEASFAVGDLQALPFGDAAFEIVLSVFGLIFAPDPRGAFDEMMRVLGPGGRAIFSAWVPAGPIDAMVGTIGRAIAAATGTAPRRFAWHEPDAVRELAAPHGARVTIHEGRLPITATSPEAYFEANESRHPMSLAGRPVLEGAGTYPAVRAEALKILKAANENPEAFTVHSPYRVIEVHRSG